MQGPCIHKAPSLVQRSAQSAKAFDDPLASAPRSHLHKAGPLLRAPRRKHLYGDRFW